MKFDRRQVILGTFILFAFFFYLLKDRERVLPSGKITTTLGEDLNLNFPSPGTENPIPGRPIISISTHKGQMTIELRPDLAPETVINFLTKWANGDCDGRIFHRVEDWVIQGCDPSGDGTGGENKLPTEVSSTSFLTGSVGVARKPFPKNLSNDSQFFIVKKDSTFLDGEYTYFGRVTEGMDVLNSIEAGDIIISTDILTK